MKKKKIVLLLIILFILIAGISISFSFFAFSKDGNNISLESGDIRLSFVNNINTIDIDHAYPISDIMGKIYPYYTDFTISGSAVDTAIKYEIQIVPSNDNTMEVSYIKCYLTNQDDDEIVDVSFYNDLPDATDKAGKVIYSGYIAGSETVNDEYRLRLWIDENYSKNIAETFSFDVYLYAINRFN